MADEQKNPTPTQSEIDKHNKEGVEQTAAEVQERVAKFYDHEDPTPTQMENDLAKVAAMNMGSIPEGGGDPQRLQHGGMPKPGDSGWINPDTRHQHEGSAEAKKKQDEQKNKQSEAATPSTGGYQTRAATPARDNAKPSGT
jgi:hypothetical protein